MIIKCPNCGKEYYDEPLSYCEVCGMSLHQSNNTVFHNDFRSEVQSQEIKDHTLAIALGFIFAFLFPIFGLIFGVYLVTRKYSIKAKICGILVIAISIIVTWVCIYSFNTNFYVMSQSNLINGI